MNKDERLKKYLADFEADRNANDEVRLFSGCVEAEVPWVGAELLDSSGGNQ